jgi:hypothetical protein
MTLSPPLSPSLSPPPPPPLTHPSSQTPADGADEHLTPLTTEAAHLTTLLDLIASHPVLQTRDVAANALQLTKFAAGLGSSMMLMVEATRRSRRLGGVEGTKVLRPGDGEYRHLGVMLGEVRGWRGRLGGAVGRVVVVSGLFSFFFLLFLSGLDWVMLGWGDPMVCLYFGRGEGFFLDQTLDGDSF